MTTIERNKLAIAYSTVKAALEEVSAPDVAANGKAKASHADYTKKEAKVILRLMAVGNVLSGLLFLETDWRNFKASLE